MSKPANLPLHAATTARAVPKRGHHQNRAPPRAIAEKGSRNPVASGPDHRGPWHPGAALHVTRAKEGSRRSVASHSRRKRIPPKTAPKP